VVKSRQVVQPLVQEDHELLVAPPPDQELVALLLVEIAEVLRQRGRLFTIIDTRRTKCLPGTLAIPISWMEVVNRPSGETKPITKSTSSPRSASSSSCSSCWVLSLAPWRFQGRIDSMVSLAPKLPSS
jgi:hypothetical protein